jgi:hypothetical protein
MELPQRARAAEPRDEPSPLRIVKRTDSRGSSDARRCASASGSEGRRPRDGASGDMGHLTVMKRRSDRGGAMRLPSEEGGSAESEERPFWSKTFNWEETTAAVGRRPVEAQTLHVRKTRRARPFLNNGEGTGSAEYRRQERTFSASTVPFRQVFGSRQHAPNNLEILTSPSGVGISVPQARDFVPRVTMPSGQRPCVLCPHVSVTSEVTALMEGQRSLWAAVEVSGRLSKLPATAPGMCPQQNIGIVTGSFIEHELGEFQPVF